MGRLDRTLVRRRAFIRKLESRLGRRKLIWFGPRGEDAQPLLALRSLLEVYSLIAPFEAIAVELNVCLETLANRRIDLDTYSLDSDKSAEAQLLRRYLLESLRSASVIIPYRPLAFLSSVFYPRKGHILFLGQFHERQTPFEHKPWVESELNSNGICTIPWRYFSDEDRSRVEDELDLRGEIVLRNNRSDGGAGFAIIKSRDDLDRNWKIHSDGFFAVAPILMPHVPLNVNACIFPGGQVTVHGVSVQLIGINSCTQREFGYCGNDFGAVRNIEPRLLGELEAIVTKAGRWLASKGYIGAFGIDAMISRDTVYLTEINPRFQGSSAISARLDEALGRPDVFLSHMAAFLGETPGDSLTLRELVTLQQPLSHLINHNTNKCLVKNDKVKRVARSGIQFELIPGTSIAIGPEAILFRAVVDKSITQNGFELSQSFLRAVESFEEASFSPVT